MNSIDFLVTSWYNLQAAKNVQLEHFGKTTGGFMANGASNGNGYTAGHTHPAVQIGRDILQFLTMVFVLWTAQQSSQNNDQIRKVETRQEVVIDKQREAAQKTTEVKETLDEKSAADEKALGIQLYSTWKYLEDVAALSMRPQDVGKAAEAKKVYENHLKKHNNKPPPKPVVPNE